MCVSVNYTQQHVFLHFQATVPEEYLHRKAINAVVAVQIRAYLAVEHLISRNVVQLHSEKVVPGQNKDRSRVSGRLPTQSFQSCRLSIENKAAGKEQT